MTLMRDRCDGVSCPFDYKREMKSLAHAVVGSSCQCFDGCQYIGPCFCFAQKIASSPRAHYDLCLR